MPEVRKIYYNENDKFAAAWLRELIKKGVIANGEVDERSIQEVTANDVRGFSQCHFFAGIGGWSYALRLAGWPDDRPVWTGSCPCQPFSAAGQRKGFDDARHLWPEWFRLIQECKPVTIFGEQVSSAMSWLDLVSGDLEGEGYAVGSAIMGAHSVGAPHIRQRIYWVADSAESRRQGTGQYEQRPPSLPARLTEYGGMGDSYQSELPQRKRNGQLQQEEVESSTGEGISSPGSVLGESGSIGRQWRQKTTPGHDNDGETSRRSQNKHGTSIASSHWGDCNWLPCIDGKSRPVESGTFPLAYGLPSRVGRLRGYGNAIVPQVAGAFIKAYMEIESA